ncbi:AAA family ATPase [Catellatospora sichuanensis]|uniref:AAA family ATPase n=1 Tax=Catellatospora sichuanensis TaxID=1969805 RepID=UPI001183FCCF|nr:ATP-binding protein [Catellatospora sichuanensis]
MSDLQPVVWLLAGLPGTGKTTFALTLEKAGVVRLSVDDRMTALHGRIGKDYAEHEHLTLLAPVVESVRRQLIELVQAGHSVVLDHGLGRRAQREELKQLVTEHGGTWRLVTFQLDRDELLRRLSRRNEDPAHVAITPQLLDWIAEHSEAPNGEGEELPPNPTHGVTGHAPVRPA